MNIGDFVEILDCDYRWTTNGFVEHKPEHVGKTGIVMAMGGIKITVQLEEEEIILHKSSVVIKEKE